MQVWRGLGKAFTLPEMLSSLTLLQATCAMVPQSPLYKMCWNVLEQDGHVLGSECLKCGQSLSESFSTSGHFKEHRFPIA